MTDLFHYQSFRRTYTFLDIYSSSSLIFNLQIFLIYLYILGKLGVDVSLEKQIKIYTTYSCLWPGFRIWSKINRIRIQPLRTNPLRIRGFCLTGSGSGYRKKKPYPESRLLCHETFMTIFNAKLFPFHSLTVLNHNLQYFRNYFYSTFCTLLCIGSGTETGSKEIWNLDPDLGKNTGSGSETLIRPVLRISVRMGNIWFGKAFSFTDFQIRPCLLTALSHNITLLSPE